MCFYTHISTILNSIAMCILLALAPMRSHAQDVGAPFSVDVVNVQGDRGASRLDIYTAIPNSSLRFLKEGASFNASYRLEVEMYPMSRRSGPSNELAQKVSWNEEVNAPDFNATQANRLVSYFTTSMEVDPGRYAVLIRVTDLSSQEVHIKELITEVRDFSEGVMASGLILVDGYDLSTHSITPEVSDRVRISEEKFKMFYELYAPAYSEVRTQVELIRTSNSRGLPFLRWFFRRGQNDASGGDITYTSNEQIALEQGRVPVVAEVPVNGFEAGEYRLRLSVVDVDGNQLDVVERAITLEWGDDAEYKGIDIDEAIAQLRYIAKKREIEEMTRPGTKQERHERFMAFWEKRDPTPGTPENEQMQEYYARIDYANRHYASGSSGWESDRGHTWVLYGKPDEVDQIAPGVNIDAPYEIWYYHRVGLRFIFVDRDGNGNYKEIKQNRPWIR